MIFFPLNSHFERKSRSMRRSSWTCVPNMKRTLLTLRMPTAGRWTRSPGSTGQLWRTRRASLRKRRTDSCPWVNSVTTPTGCQPGPTYNFLKTPRAVLLRYQHDCASLVSFRLKSNSLSGISQELSPWERTRSTFERKGKIRESNCYRFRVGGHNYLTNQIYSFEKKKKHMY